MNYGGIIWKLYALIVTLYLLKVILKKIKSDIHNYHQGFMIVNDVLYIPLYEVLKRGYKLPSNYETTIIDLSDVTDFDDMASYFYNVTDLSLEDVIDLYNNRYDFEELLPIVDDLAEANYQQGFTQGYNEGDEDGYNKCYHFNKEYK